MSASLSSICGQCGLFCRHVGSIRVTRGIVQNNSPRRNFHRKWRSAGTKSNLGSKRDGHRQTVDASWMSKLIGVTRSRWKCRSRLGHGRSGFSGDVNAPSIPAMDKASESKITKVAQPELKAASTVECGVPFWSKNFQTFVECEGRNIIATFALWIK